MLIGHVVSKVFGRYVWMYYITATVFNFKDFETKIYIANKNIYIDSSVKNTSVWVWCWRFLGKNIWPIKYICYYLSTHKIYWIRFFSWQLSWQHKVLRFDPKSRMQEKISLECTCNALQCYFQISTFPIATIKIEIAQC